MIFENELFLYITIGVLFNLFIDGLMWFLFKYEFLGEEDKQSNIPWDTWTKIVVTCVWPVVVLFLIWTVFINPRKTEDNE